LPAGAARARNEHPPASAGGFGMICAKILAMLLVEALSKDTDRKDSDRKDRDRGAELIPEKRQA